MSMKDMLDNTELMSQIMSMPDADSMNDDMRKFMADGYIMGKNCFGKDSRQYADRLMEFINDEFADHIYYGQMARKAPSQNAKKVFRTLSEDEMRHARQFAAAYFLITGKRYFPARESIKPVEVPPSYLQALRQRYLAEARDAVKYRIFAQETKDPCLKKMMSATSSDENRHEQKIMHLLQAM